MPPNDELVALALLLLGCFVLVSTVLAVLSVAIRPLVNGWPASARLRASTLLLVSPVISASALAMLASAPHLWATVMDHCALHAADHGCGWHLPIEGTRSAGMTLATVLSVFAPLMSFKAARVISQHRRLQRLLALARFDHDLGAFRLPIAAPMAFTAGLLRPGIYLSDGLLDALNSGQIQQVLAHEQAHVARRDGLLKLGLSVLSAGHWPAVRRQLFRDWELACEQRCDAAAAETPSKATDLAECLVRVGRLTLAHQPVGPSVCRLDGGHLEQRIWALLEPAERPSRTSHLLLAAAFAAVLTTVASLAPPIHLLLEQIT